MSAETSDSSHSAELREAKEAFATTDTLDFLKWEITVTRRKKSDKFACSDLLFRIRFFDNHEKIKHGKNTPLIQALGLMDKVLVSVVDHMRSFFHSPGRTYLCFFSFHSKELGT